MSSAAEDNWLPPDNVQENPDTVVAHRTSPTNMGLSLLANLAAHDFGYLSTERLIARTASAFATMQRMERYRGHFFNWYDTRTLEPLPPRYVSTVDSSNLAGHLLTLQPGLRGLADQKIFPARWLDAFADTLAVLRAVADDDAMPRLGRLEKALESEAADPPTTLAAARGCLQRLAAHVHGQRRQCASGTGQRSPRVAGKHCSAIVAMHSTKSSSSRPGARCRRYRNASRGPRISPPSRRCARSQRFPTKMLPIVEQASASDLSAAERESLAALAALLRQGAASAADRMAAIEALALQVDELSAQEYEFLYDESRHLLAIGYNVTEHRRDASYYDLLASEARLCSFVGIAQGRLPQESWFALGRLLTHAAGEPILLSWSGSMFEYLMPLLVMPTFANTLLDQTAHAAVKRQIQYGNQRGVPWGISECGLQHGRRSAQLSVSRFRRAGPGLAAGTGGGPGHRAVRVGTRADDQASRGLQQPAKAGGGRLPRTVRHVRVRRLHARALAARGDERDRALVHGPPSGHDVALARVSAARSADASAIRLGRAIPVDAPAAPGARAEGPRAVLEQPRARGLARGARGGRAARARPHDPRHADSSRAALVQWPLSRHGHQCRRRIQPLAGHCRHALARGHDLRFLGHLLLSPRCGKRQSLVTRLRPRRPALHRVRGELHRVTRRVSPP